MGVAATVRVLVATVALLNAAAWGRRPNFVIILADDMGYADASCYGNERFRTPHLDAMAKEGLRFTDFHSNGPVCSPTRAALMTGRYQQRCGVEEVVFADSARGHRENHGLKATEITFAKMLVEAGYRTAIFGKWHLGYAKKFNPVHHGFKEFRGYVSGNVDYQAHIDGAGFADWWNGLELEEERGYSTHLITKHAVEFIERNKGEAFCLYVAHEAVHGPYQGPDDPPVRQGGRKGAEKGGQVQRAYGEMLREMDKGVGEVLAAIRRAGIEKTTLVFFFSDNGGTPHANNGPLHGFKGSLWEGGHREPAIAWWPGKIAPGVTGETGMGMDLMPTMLDLAGVKTPAGHKLDGVSLGPVLLEGKKLAERALFWKAGQKCAVRRGEWKLVKEKGGGLFNLASDVGERTDLSDTMRGKVAELESELGRWRKAVGR